MFNASHFSFHFPSFHGPSRRLIGDWARDETLRYSIVLSIAINALLLYFLNFISVGHFLKPVFSPLNPDRAFRVVFVPISSDWRRQARPPRQARTGINVRRRAISHQRLAPAPTAPMMVMVQTPRADRSDSAFGGPMGGSKQELTGFTMPAREAQRTGVRAGNRNATARRKAHVLQASRPGRRSVGHRTTSLSHAGLTHTGPTLLADASREARDPDASIANFEKIPLLTDPSGVVRSTAIESTPTDAIPPFSAKDQQSGSADHGPSALIPPANISSIGEDGPPDGRIKERYSPPGYGPAASADDGAGDSSGSSGQITIVFGHGMGGDGGIGVGGISSGGPGEFDYGRPASSAPPPMEFGDQPNAHGRRDNIVEELPFAKAPRSDSIYSRGAAGSNNPDWSMRLRPPAETGARAADWRDDMLQAGPFSTSSGKLDLPAGLACAQAVPFGDLERLANVVRTRRPGVEMRTLHRWLDLTIDRVPTTPLLVLDASRPVHNSGQLRDNLKQFVAAGGMIWCDAGDRGMDAGFRMVLCDLFGQPRMLTVDRDPIFSSDYSLSAMPVSSSGLAAEPEGMSLPSQGDRLAVIITHGSLLRDVGSDVHEAVTELAVNVVLYALGQAEFAP